MNRITTSAAFITCALLLAVAGCAKKETTAETQADVAKAQNEGARDVATAQNDASEKMADATEQVTKAQSEAAQTSAGTTRDMTIAEAEAAHKVAIERCEAQSGDARRVCKNVADTDLAAAKAHAEAKEAAQNPNP